MKITEKRECQECKNLITLNLFRPDCLICRYCQDGILFPKRLEDKKQQQFEDSTEQENVIISNEEPFD